MTSVLDRLDQLEREGADMRLTVIPSEDGTSLTILDHVAISRAHLRALLDVAQAAKRTRGSEMTMGWTDLMAALVPLLEEETPQ